MLGRAVAPGAKPNLTRSCSDSSVEPSPDKELLQPLKGQDCKTVSTEAAPDTFMLLEAPLFQGGRLTWVGMSSSKPKKQFPLRRVKEPRLGLTLLYPKPKMILVRRVPESIILPHVSHLLCSSDKEVASFDRLHKCREPVS